jgi:hypothetical protein
LDGREANIDDLMKFVLKVALRENHAYADVNSMKQKAPEKKTEKDVRPKNPGRVFSGKKSTNHTVTDEEKSTVLAPLKLQSSQQSLSHTLEHCKKFKGLNLQDRLSQRRKLEICFNCLRKGHASIVCKFESNCPITSCDKKHHGLFHFYKGEEPYKNPKQAPRKPTNEDDASSKKPDPVIRQKVTGAGGSAEAGSQVSYHVSLTTNRISLGILPVVIKAKGFDTDIKVYALLDDG